MKKLIFISISFLLISCSSEGEQNQILESNYSNDEFSLSIDNSWKLRNLQGIDSYVGYYYKNTDTIRFDCGWYGFSDLDDIQNNPNYLHYEEALIDSCSSKIIFFNSGENQKTLTVFIEKKNDSLMKNILFIKNPSNVENIINILKTHKFK